VARVLWNIILSHTYFIVILELEKYLLKTAKLVYLFSQKP